MYQDFCIINYVYDYSFIKYAPGFCILHKFLFTHIQTSGNYTGDGCFVCVCVCACVCVCVFVCTTTSIKYIYLSDNFADVLRAPLLAHAPLLADSLLPLFPLVLHALCCFGFSSSKGEWFNGVWREGGRERERERGVWGDVIQ